MYVMLLTLVIAQPPIPGGPPPIGGPPAIKKMRPTGDHVLFVGVEEAPVGKRTTFRDDDAYRQTGVYWITSKGAWRILDETDIDASIRHDLERVVSRPAAPFVEPEGDPSPTGLWAPNVEWFVGLEKYAPAKNTQSLSRVGSFSYRDSNIAIVSRMHLKAKWQVPGGMEGVSGWRSDLYRYVPNRKQYIGMVAVFNGNNDQFEQGHKREYADGTQFHDVLSYKGKVFEHRVAEKRGGQWERFVAYKDTSARPLGYFGLRQSCISCHSEAGTGGYASGLVPGGDTILSDPLQGIE